MKALLDKIRHINRSIQHFPGLRIDYDGVALSLCDVLEGRVYFADKKGQIFGCNTPDGLPALIPNQLENELAAERALPSQYHDMLLNTDSTIIYQGDEAIPLHGTTLCITPIIGGGERLGVILTARERKQYDENDLIVAEYAGTLIGMGLLWDRSDRVENEFREKAACQVAINSLSFSEQEAVRHVFSRLTGFEGLVVASRIAEEVGITRSVIVNGLKKLESAGVIESRSLGMRGTYVRVLNGYFLDELSNTR